MAFFSAPVWAAIGAVAKAISYFEQQDAREDQQRAQESMAAERRTQYANEQKRAEIQNVRQIRQQIRQQRAAAASIIGRGATTGTLGSSGVQGGVASTGSQLAGNLSYMSNIADVNTANAASSERFASAELQAGQAAGDLAAWGAFGNLGNTIFTQAGGITAFGGKQANNMGTGAK